MTDDEELLYLECGRWRNGRLSGDCLKAGTEDCMFCPNKAVIDTGDELHQILGDALKRADR